MTVKFKYVGKQELKAVFRNRRVVLTPGMEFNVSDKLAERIRNSPYYSRLFQELPLEDRIERLECAVRLIVKELKLDMSECM